MNEKKEDLRVKKTKIALKTALSKLILEKDFDDITVTALCGEAMINKKTFYNYYKTTHDLLSAIIEEYLQNFIDRIKQYTLPQDLYETNREFFLFSNEQDKIYERLICSPSYNPFGAKMLYSFTSAAWKETLKTAPLNENQKEILINFLSVCGTEFYRQWVKGGKSIPLQDMIKFSGELICSGTNGLLK